MSDDAAGPSPRRLRAKAPWLALAAGCLAADLVSKWAVFYPHVLEEGFREGRVVGEVASWWRTILVYNEGITFGSFQGAGTWLLGLLTAVVIAFLLRILWTLPPGRPVKSFALSIIIGGATGNLYDRTLRPIVEEDKRPGVRDFLDWHAPDHWSLHGWLVRREWPTHWFTSNVADVFIVTGVILLAICLLREPDEEPGAPEVARP